MSFSQDRIKEMWMTHSLAEVARAVEMGEDRVKEIARGLKLPSREEVREMRDCPNADEIIARAAEVRSRWTASEERRRRVGWTGRYEAPQLKSSQVFPVFQGQLR